MAWAAITHPTRSERKPPALGMAIVEEREMGFEPTTTTLTTWRSTPELLPRNQIPAPPVRGPFFSIGPRGGIASRFPGIPRAGRRANRSKSFACRAGAGYLGRIGDRA